MNTSNITNKERFQIFKILTKERHIRFYYYIVNNGLKKVQLGDVVTNRLWINQNISESFISENTIDCFICGYDSCLRKIIIINESDVIWDEINGFYDNIPVWDKQEVERIENKIRFIGNGSYYGVKDPIYSKTQSKLAKFSKRRNKDSHNFSISIKDINNGNDFMFDDYINDEYFNGIIPFDYVFKHKTGFYPKGKLVCWFINENDIVKYFRTLQPNF